MPPEKEKPTKKREKIDPELMKSLWNSFKEKRKEIGRNRELNVLNLDFELKGEVVMLTLLNPIQGDILADFRDELLSFLRAKLQNDFLSIETKIAQQDEKRMVYTSKEKLDHLIQKNPQLKNLKDSLGLDNEY